MRRDTLTCSLYIATVPFVVAGAVATRVHPTAVAPAHPAPSGALYVANANNTVTVYAATAAGNAAPLRTLRGPARFGVDASGLAVDAVGNLYVAHGLSPYGNRVDVYAGGAQGSAAPARIITGKRTRLDTPFTVAIDARGALYVANEGTGQTGSITVYAPGAHGDSAPLRRIAGPHSMVQTPQALAVDARGTLYVADYGDESRVLVFAPTARGDARPIRVIAGDRTGLNNPSGLAIDATGYLYTLSSGTQRAAVFAPGARGNVAPVRTIAGPRTRLAGADALILVAGNVVVANDPRAQNIKDAHATDYIGVFAPTARGNSAPVRTIGGPATRLYRPSALAAGGA
jgi:sugar lactone lactonase YvrE